MEYQTAKKILEHEFFQGQDHLDKRVHAWEGGKGFFHPFKLWSLWDMLRITAETYINLGKVLADFTVMFYRAESSQDMPIKDEERADLQKFLVRLKEHTDKLNLKVSSAILKKKLDDLPQNLREFNMLEDMIREEIRSNLFIYILPHKSKYHEFASSFNDISGFPESSKELIRAGNCYAVNENTACVFHSMRAAELGLRALAKHLGIAFPYPLELADWQNIIEKIESKIKALNQLPKGAAKDEELKFCSNAATQFRYFKDAYRKHVTHARENYDENRALTIMEHTMEFIYSLSSKISE